MEEQLKRGVLEMCVLSLLSHHNYHGYKMAKEIRALFPEVTESTVYGILRRLHADGSVDVFFETNQNSPNRKYYKINEQGKKMLSSAISMWLRIAHIVEDICL